MITISLCMIVRNEEGVLDRCLSSAQGIADEIIIVDTGSTDRTKEIAARYTDKIYDFPWIDDFSAARNFGLEKAKMDYLLWLDADDVITPPNQAAFARLKEELDPQTAVVMMQYQVAFDAAGQPSFTYYRERLLKNGMGFRFAGAIHEAISPRGKVLHSDIAIQHRKIGPGDPDRNLRIFEKMIAAGKHLQPREQFYYARELYYHQRYADAAAVFKRFLDEQQGWLENNIDATKHLALCYYALGQEQQALDALLWSLRYDCPRAEVCCDIGKHFLERGRLKEAIFWYETASKCQRDDFSGAFVLPDCYGYIPYLQLCLCHYRLGDDEKASYYNELAGKIKPDDDAVRQNRAFFASRKREE